MQIFASTVLKSFLWRASFPCLIFFLSLALYNMHVTASTDGDC